MTKNDRVCRGRIYGALGALLFLLGYGCSISSVFVSQKADPASGGGIPDSEIVQSVFLIGDAGEEPELSQEPVLAALEHEAKGEWVGAKPPFMHPCKDLPTPKKPG